MSVTTSLKSSAAVIGRVRLTRLAALLAFGLIAGLVADWFRSDQRLVFERPLPVLTTTPPSP